MIVNPRGPTAHGVGLAPPRLRYPLNKHRGWSTCEPKGDLSGCGIPKGCNPLGRRRGVVGVHGAACEPLRQASLASMRNLFRSNLWGLNLGPKKSQEATANRDPLTTLNHEHETKPATFYSSVRIMYRKISVKNNDRHANTCSGIMLYTFEFLSLLLHSIYLGTLSYGC